MLLSDPDRTQEFDHVIFDTAPTGHTLRLLELPAAWTGFLENAPGDVSCLGPLSGLKTQRERYARTVSALADPNLTAIMLVARPERVALLEATHTSVELRSQAMTNQLLVINGVFHATDRNDPLAAAFERRGAEALLHVPEEVASLQRAEIPLVGGNIVGLEVLRSLFTPLRRLDAGTSEPVALPQDIACLADVVDELRRSDHGLIMVMGKGGVGKTTIAAAVAVSLAKRGMPVHLTTTDPAQHIWDTLQSKVTGLRVSYIDPKQEARQYRKRMLESARTTLATEKLALFEEELKSPCYEEVAVFQAFSRIVMGARKELVVIDTAPTGHTLLLLDTAAAYHRQLTQQTALGPGRFRTPLMMLQDPEYTKVLIVALPETTPVLEAAALQDDLRRAQIEPFAWVINGSLAAAHPRDPILRARAAAEIPQIHKVKELLAQRVALIPFQAEEPVGVERLNSLAIKFGETHITVLRDTTRPHCGSGRREKSIR